MIIVTDLNNKVFDVFPVRGNTIVRKGFRVYHDDLVQKEDLKKGDTYIPDKEHESFYMEEERE